MILKLETLERKSEARAAYGFRCDWSVLGTLFEPEVPRFLLVEWAAPLVWTPLVSFVSGEWTASLFSAGEAQVGHIFEDDSNEGRGVDYNLQIFLGKGFLCSIVY
jgi:hypothetical protein